VILYNFLNIIAIIVLWPAEEACNLAEPLYTVKVLEFISGGVR
jgi:hypothetical protein